jgi:hypothetical protein
VVHGAGLVGRRTYLWVDECSRVVDLGVSVGGSGPAGLILELGYTPCQVRGGSLGVGHGALEYEFGGRGAGGARPDNKKKDILHKLSG